jgi:hypothetical protein
MKCSTLAIVACALLCAACSQKSVPVGAERGPCYGNGSCNQGLVCLSDLCVQPPPPDCQAVATRLNYLVLGNYAQKSERDAYISQQVTACKQAKLSKEDADCIIAAKNRTDLSRCPQSLIMGSCEQAVAHANKILTGADPTLVDLIDPKPALRRCRERGITKQEEECVLRATNKQQLDACGRF